MSRVSIIYGADLKV